MIYYPLETLLRAGIREILIIVAPEHAGDFVNLLGSGREFGARFLYEVQDKPEGLAQAFLIANGFIDEEDKVTMILGDNLFEDDFSSEINAFQAGAKVFAKEVKDPERFGVVEVGKDGKVLSIEEKPRTPKGKYAITGLYMFDSSVVGKAKNLQRSERGELEITDLIRQYLDEGSLSVSFVEGAWIDTGTFESMYVATEFVRRRHLLSNA